MHDDLLPASREDHSVPSIDRFLLVEQNVISGQRYGTLHPNQEQAAVYNQDQEYHHEWFPIALYDLATGKRYGATRQTLFHSIP